MKFNIKTLGLTCLFILLLLSSMSFAIFNDPIYTNKSLFFYQPTNITSTKVIDISTNIHNGTMSGIVSVLNDSISPYMNFNANGWVDVATPESFNANPFTISMWLNNSLTGQGTIVTFGSRTETFASLFIYSGGGGLDLLMGNVARTGWAQNTAIMATTYENKWVHVVYTRQGTNLVVYADGWIRFNQTIADPTIFSNIYLGSGMNGNSFKGQIAGFHILNRSMYNAEVLFLNSSGRGYDYSYINQIIINSNNLIAQYSNEINTTNSGYWNAKNFTISYDITNSNNISINISKNGILQTNTTFWISNALIGDNITFSIIAFNKTLNATNSKTFTILPPQINYNNVINSSTLEKQNLLCNYSITKENNTFVDWLVNNTIIKSNSINFNITDYTNSILGLPLSCRLNNSVPTQSYTSYNYSNNNIIIGQNITFTAKLNYSLVDI